MQQLSKLHQLWQLLVGLGIILFVLWLGNTISNMTGDYIPGSIIGMVLLATSLQLRVIRLTWVEGAANQFIRWMSLLFVPIGVGLVEQLDVLSSALLAIIITCIFATLALLALVGWGVQLSYRSSERQSS
ncbi:CidA/LrgA family protein [Neiella sp. HB171785]|uniref:CidA/LrgA family protein n=1 Tax=Neiella litorisoli TaxID=2771431 RepID=A0A8J6QSS6_9GAMM|nr:CidA/LrgA family protein [Neiella litorisoli]MBD1388057.1 CidA/LrgA family protein [Neiella litorisoli]